MVEKLISNFFFNDETEIFYQIIWPELNCLRRPRHLFQKIEKQEHLSGESVSFIVINELKDDVSPVIKHVIFLKLD